MPEEPPRYPFGPDAESWADERPPSGSEERPSTPPHELSSGSPDGGPSSEWDDDPDAVSEFESVDWCALGHAPERIEVLNDALRDPDDEEPVYAYRCRRCHTTLYPVTTEEGTKMEEEPRLFALPEPPDGRPEWLQQRDYAPGRVRKDDYVTSRAGAEAVSYRAGSQKAKLMEVYKQAPWGLTDEEAAERAGLLEIGSCYWKRCGELRDDGSIVATGETRRGHQGVERIVCRVAAAQGSVDRHPSTA